MKVENNKMVGVDYKLTVDGQIADQSRPGQPLEFIFGTGMLLPKFEEAILGKEIGESVSFTLEAKDGYGEVIADAIVDLPKDIFMVDGKLAEDILFEGSQVPMSDAQGNRMMGIVKEVGESTVKMDFNHPMAGKTLNFDVEVVSVRDVTPEDLQGGCSCGECGGDCGEGCGDHDGLRANRYHPTKKPGLRVRFFSGFSQLAPSPTSRTTLKIRFPPRVYPPSIPAGSSRLPRPDAHAG